MTKRVDEKKEIESLVGMGLKVMGVNGWKVKIAWGNDFDIPCGLMMSSDKEAVIRCSAEFLGDPERVQKLIESVIHKLADLATSNMANEVVLQRNRLAKLLWAALEGAS